MLSSDALNCARKNNNRKAHQHAEICDYALQFSNYSGVIQVGQELVSSNLKRHQC
jgi:hypothetical protein